MLRYSRYHLGWLALILALATCFFLAVFANRDARVPGIVGVLISSDLGHFVLLPMIVLFFAMGAIRLGMMFAGPLDALMTDQAGVRVTTIWRSYTIHWQELRQIRLTFSKFRNQTRYELKFYRESGAVVSLPLGAVALPESEYKSVLEQLLLAHRKAMRGMDPSPRRSA